MGVGGCHWICVPSLRGTFSVVATVFLVKILLITPSGGSLGSRVDEDRSKLRVAM